MSQGASCEGSTEPPDSVSSLVAAAARALSTGDVAQARLCIASINQAALVLRRNQTHIAVWGPDGLARRLTRPPSRPRIHVTKSLKLATFRRDRYVCRYEHCRGRTFALPVLKALARGLPDLLTYRSNWRPVNEHILFWMYSASLEHRLSFLHGGTSDPENLITACYGCNDLKNWLHADDLGWKLTAPTTDGWDGLEGLVPSLRARGLLTIRDL